MVEREGTRRTRLIAAIALALALGSSGCQAYRYSYWSFPMNSMQMVETASRWDEPTYRKALGAELVSQLFPYYWILSLVDLLLLPITLPHDGVVLAIGDEDGADFAKQVRKEQADHGREAATPAVPGRDPTAPAPTPHSGFDR